MAAPRCFFLFDGKLREPFHELGHAPRLAKELRLGIFKLRWRSALREQTHRVLDQRIQIVHIDFSKTTRASAFSALALALIARTAIKK